MIPAAPVAAPGAAGQAPGMSEPNEDEQVNLRPGQYDEGGHGGMATRELAAHQAEEQAEDD
ncbi:hypothetical protein A7K94_0201530 [Modestobacter sp. VKM Ac-2676]|nr:hypothetical protein A7K94_0201530 [Modestobacter sp. VKM Ac-2676]